MTWTDGLLRHTVYVGLREDKPATDALQDASSVAGLTITTEAMVAETPKGKGGSGDAVVTNVWVELVAKLDCALGPGKFEHNSCTTADEQVGRKGDFFIGDVAIHVTTSPGEAVIQRCRDNLSDGHRAVLVTRQRGLTVAEALAENVGLGDRIDIFEIEQFIALNLYEMGKFVMEGRRAVLKDFVAATTRSSMRSRPIQAYGSNLVRI